MHSYGFLDDGVTWTGIKTGEVPVSSLYESTVRGRDETLVGKISEKTTDCFSVTRGECRTRCFSFILTRSRTAREPMMSDLYKSFNVINSRKRAGTIVTLTMGEITAR